MVSMLALACSSPKVVQTALHGNLASLKREIHRAQQAHALDRAAVEELAQAVAARELQSSQGAAAIRRVRAVRACAGHLLAVLHNRAERLDAAGAAATLLLLETHRLAASPLVERYQDADDGAWRAVAARASVAPRHAELRRRFIVDHDERVRRAALGAMLAVPDPDDLAPVLEATRLDPDPLSRSLAARAAGAIGGPRVALALKDYWARADEATRMLIIQAWEMHATRNAGGREALIWAAETQDGRPAIAAIGTAVLLRAVQEGTREERRLALRLAPVADPDVQRELQHSSADSDRDVQVMALARMLAQADRRSFAQSRLQVLARGKDRIAVQARAALAAAGDRSVADALRAQLRTGSSHRRRVAALGLLRLGLYPAAATALADDDPAVRTAVACQVLAQAK
jgi:hypothetical protein